MNREVVDKIVNAVLYEGYMLYPYRRSALKNRYRWNFGVVYPRGIEPSSIVTECLMRGGPDTALTVEVRFLQVYEQDSWQEAIERRFTASETGSHSIQFDHLRGVVNIELEPVEGDVQKLRVTISNHTPIEASPNRLLGCFVSTHAILMVRNGEFVSLQDPPEDLRAAAANCCNGGAWPVLVGAEPERDCVLASPIILSDYPSVAVESPGDLFDGAEIDEILTLRILTLTDAEKDEMRRSGERERRILERTESLTPEQLLKLHGTVRIPGTSLKRGDRVRLRPRPRGDVFDIVLAGRVGIVESIEQDFDNRTHIAVVIEDDPGQDLGFMRQPGHRFFFSSDEVERIA